MTQTILQRVAAGEAAAIDECFARYRGLVWSLARRFTRNHADAEDSVQEIFLDVWRNASRFEPTAGSEANYVAMLARRRLIDRYRKTRRALDTQTLSAEPAGATDEITVMVELEEEVARARQGMKQLRPQERQVIELLASGMSQSEVAAAVSLPLGTVKTHTRRGLIRLREILAVTSDHPSSATGDGAPSVLSPSRLSSPQPFSPYD